MKKTKAQLSTIIVIVILTMFVTITSFSLFSISKSIEMKVTTPDKQSVRSDMIDQFVSLERYFSEKYESSASAIYLIQPKNYKKMYLEKAIEKNNEKFQSVLMLPNIIDIDDNVNVFIDLEREGYSKITKNSKHLFSNKLIEMDNLNVCYVFPIYKNHSVIAEVYQFYKEDKQFTKKEISRMVYDWNMLSKFLY